MKTILGIMDSVYQRAKEIFLPGSKTSQSCMPLRPNKGTPSLSAKSKYESTPLFERLDSTGEVVSSEYDNPVTGSGNPISMKMTARSRSTTVPIPNSKGKNNKSTVFGCTHRDTNWTSTAAQLKKYNLDRSNWGVCSSDTDRSMFNFEMENIDFKNSVPQTAMTFQRIENNVMLPNPTTQSCFERKKNVGSDQCSINTNSNTSGVHPGNTDDKTKEHISGMNHINIKKKMNILNHFYEYEISHMDQNMFCVNICQNQSQEGCQTKLMKERKQGEDKSLKGPYTSVCRGACSKQVKMDTKPTETKMGSSPKRIPTQEVKMSGCVQLVTSVSSGSPLSSNSSSVNMHGVPTNGAVHITFTPPQQTYKMYKKKQKCRPSAKKRRRANKNRDQDNGDDIHEHTCDKDDNVTSQRQGNNCSNSSGKSTNTKQSASAISRFHVVFEQLSSDSLNSSFESLILESPKGNTLSPKFSFLITGADLETSDSESDNDSNEDEGFDDTDNKLWESFENSRHDPFSFSFTCSINSKTEKESHVATENITSPCSSPSTSSPLSSSPDTLSIKQLVQQANQKWHAYCIDTQQPQKCSHKETSVKFAEGRDLATVNHMVAWRYAYAAARKGPWEEYARDRDRFQNRISQVESSIAHIFETGHRERMCLQLYG